MHRLTASTGPGTACRSGASAPLGDGLRLGATRRRVAVLSRARDAIVRRRGVRGAVGVGVAIVTWLGVAFGPTTSASAHGTPITVGTPGSSGAPALAVDAGGTHRLGEHE